MLGGRRCGLCLHPFYLPIKVAIHRDNPDPGGLVKEPVHANIVDLGTASARHDRVFLVELCDQLVVGLLVIAEGALVKQSGMLW